MQAHKARNKQKRKGNRRFFRILWLVMVLLIALSAGFYAVNGINDMLAVGRESISVTVDLPVDPTNEEVAEILEEKGIIKDRSFFELYAAFTNSSDYYSNGTFQLDTSMDYQALSTRCRKPPTGLMLSPS